MTKINQKSIGRRFAFQFLYHLQLPEFESEVSFPPNDLDQKIEDFEGTYNEPDQESQSTRLTHQGKVFATHLIHGVIQYKKELEESIRPFLKTWAIERLDRVDLTILLLGAFELTEMPDTPKKVAINEAIELGKLFGTRDTPSFINAVLDSMEKA